MKPIDERAALKAFIERKGSQKEAAALLGISPTFVIDILKGYRKCPARILDIMGFRRTAPMVVRKSRKARQLIGSK